MERTPYGQTPNFTLSLITPEQLEELKRGISEQVVLDGIKYLSSHHSSKEDVFFTRKEAALYIKHSVTTLYNWDISGYLKADRVGRKCLYSKSKLDKFREVHNSRKQNSNYHI